MLSTPKIRKILAQEGLIKLALVPGTLGAWHPVVSETWDVGKIVEWALPVKDSYGSLLIGTITMEHTNSGVWAWRWKIYMKPWEIYNPNKHWKLLKNDFRPAEKGSFVRSDKGDFGKTLQDDLKKRMVEQYGAQFKDSLVLDTTQTPPSAEGMVQALKDVEGVSFGTPSKYGQTASYEIQDTNAQAQKQFQTLLLRAGFSGFNRGKFQGSGETGVSATYEKGGRVFATFRTWTTYGEPTTEVSVRAEWSTEELSG